MDPDVSGDIGIEDYIYDGSYFTFSSSDVLSTRTKMNTDRGLSKNQNHQKSSSSKTLNRSRNQINDNEETKSPQKGQDVPKTYMNTLAALIIAIRSHYPQLDETYLVKSIEATLSLDDARVDAENFMKIIAKLMCQSFETISTRTFGTVQHPKMKSIVHNISDLTKSIDYTKMNFTVRPENLKSILTIQTTVIETLANTITELSMKLEKSIVSLQPYIELANELNPNAIKGLLQHNVHEESKTNKKVTLGRGKELCSDQKNIETLPNSWREVVEKSKKRKPIARRKSHSRERSLSRNRPKNITIVGTTGTTYMGLKNDVCLKIQMAKNISLQDVKNMVASAGQIQSDEVLVEELNSSSRHYANAYRCTAKAVTVPIAEKMVKDASCWPVGVMVQKWMGRVMPITKKTKIKIFVGNLGPESTNENVAKKIQEIYEKHNVTIESASAVNFLGKKSDEQINNKTVKNFITTIQSKQAGIDMEPIRLEIRSGTLPTSLYIRRYNEKPAKVSW